MTWKTFLQAIKDSGLQNDGLEKILMSLFQEAKCNAEPAESTIKSWIHRNRKFKGSSYFPGKKINENGAFNFFRDKPESDLKKLQEKFREINDTDSPINLKTNDLYVFCWSLVNQFLDLLKFQRLDIKTEDPVTYLNDAEIHIPDEYRNCVYCTKWKGDIRKAKVTPNGVYGICKIYNKEQLSTGGKDCKLYDSNWAEMAKTILTS